jgi:hypothetical protein
MLARLGRGRRRSLLGCGSAERWRKGSKTLSPARSHRARLGWFRRPDGVSTLASALEAR